MVEPTGYTALDLIGFTDKGPYDPTANYVRNDLVHVDNSTWRCKIDDTTGITPTEGVNWTIFIESATSLAGMDDVNIATPANGDLLQYNSTNSKWKNSHDVWSTMAQNGAHNLMPFPYYSGGTQTLAGVTLNIASDGVVTASGTLTDSGTFTFLNGKLPKGSYVMKWIGTYTGTMDFAVRDETASIDIGNGFGDITFTVDSTNENHTFSTYLYLGSGAITIDGAPLLRIASDTDTTYTPYAKTNKELTDGFPQMKENIEYKTNEFFLGRPVYTYVFSIGHVNTGETTVNLPAAVATSLSTGYPVDCIMFANNSNGRSIWLNDTTLVFPKYGTTDKLSIANSPYEHGSATFILKYTK